LVRALADNQTIPDLDASTKQLLDEIALFQHREKDMTVTELMNLAHIASPATLHRKLNTLIDAHMVNAVFHGNNRRTKYMALTKEGESYFHRLSDAIQMTQPVHI
jgi:DNA-binding MarR family transcriptional regulator